MWNVPRAARGAVQKVENNEGTALEKYVKIGVFLSIKDYCYKGREKKFFICQGKRTRND